VRHRNWSCMPPHAVKPRMEVYQDWRRVNPEFLRLRASAAHSGVREVGHLGSKVICIASGHARLRASQDFTQSFASVGGRCYQIL